NRIDEIVVFHALSRAQLKEIIEIQLERLRKLLSDRRITIELSDAAKELIVSEGYDPAFGARPLKRVIQHRIADPLALEILQGKIQEGDHVLVDALGDELTFTALEVLTA
ncbi:MAG: type VI secretion system ATPase TssH, partial [Caldilinea sp.]